VGDGYLVEDLNSAHFAGDAFGYFQKKIREPAAVQA
jgi:hypothetical protein